MIHTKKINFTLKEFLAIFSDSIKFHYAGLYTWSIFVVIFVLSLMVGVRLQTSDEMFMAGEIATSDVYAERTLRVEDPYATQLRREQTMALQPIIFDLNRKNIQNFREDIIALLTSISSHGLDIDSLTDIQNAFNTQHGTEFERDFFAVFAFPETQEYMVSQLIPFAENILINGIFADKNQIVSISSAILLRDSETGSESLLIPSNNPLPDLNSFYLTVSQELSRSNLEERERLALLKLVEVLAQPTLIVNNQASLERASSIVSAVPPIYYYIQQGELIAAEGDLISREQQLKMQTMYRFTARGLDITKFAGTFILALAFTYGLFFSPMGSTGSRLYHKAQLFIAFHLLTFGLIAFVYGIFLQTYIQPSETLIWGLAFPVAGCIGLSSLVFSARRYFSLSILLSLFTTLLLQGDLALFLYYFLGAMMNTLLIFKSQSRQDVVRGTMLLFCAQILFGLGAVLFSQMDFRLLPQAFIAVLVNSVLSLFVIFAFSPIIEMLFGLTTRFRLMELMNLEQPLLQELMMTAPGTYHHSVIVSNLVESGANAIHANSLLCKVAALYHDIGKIVRPDYFIENQINIPNKHDALAPAMSALILISHVKQGVELAEKYNLGREITELIKQHHGDRCITYFYNKAVKAHKGEGEVPHETDYSYPYHKPRTKEAAILMLADVVEASSRTLSDPTPARIQSHVRTMIHNIHTEGQLDDSELTFKDLTLVAESFTRILNGLFHQRIIYPEKGK